jgi:hypothetical protein
MRATPATGCSSVNNSDWIRAIVHYEGADNSQPTSQNWTITDMSCVDEDGLVPYVPLNVGYLSYGDQANISLVLGNFEHFTMGGTSLEIDWEDPTLMLAEKADPNYPAQYNVLEVNGTDNTVFPLDGRLLTFVSGSTLWFNLLPPLRFPIHSICTATTFCKSPREPVSSTKVVSKRDNSQIHFVET